MRCKYLVSQEEWCVSQIQYRYLEKSHTGQLLAECHGALKLPSQSSFTWFHSFAHLKEL